VFSIDALTGVFPDAMLVLAHRDPGHVLVSAAQLTELLRAPFTTTIDRGRSAAKWPVTGRRGCGAWSSLPMIRPFRSGSGTSIIARSSPTRLERSLGSMMRLALNSRARAAMPAKVARAPNGGYGANRYRPEELGIDRGARERFGVAS
jgi:hypothetical protein